MVCSKSWLVHYICTESAPHPGSAYTLSHCITSQFIAHGDWTPCAGALSRLISCARGAPRLIGFPALMPRLNSCPAAVALWNPLCCRRNSLRPISCLKDLMGLFSFYLSWDPLSRAIIQTHFYSIKNVILNYSLMYYWNCIYSRREHEPQNFTDSIFVLLEYWSMFLFLLLLFFCGPNQDQTALLLKFLDRTQLDTLFLSLSLCKTPKNERSARRRRLFLHSPQNTNIHAFSGIRTRDSSSQATTDVGLRLHGHKDRLKVHQCLGRRTLVGG
jgi:hypothetical protein